MRIAVLTAAVQEPFGREIFNSDPKKAAMDAALEWIAKAKLLGIDLELAAALARPDSYIPPEAMLDPVAAHLAARTFKDGSGDDLSDEDAQTIINACGQDVRICDLGFFENLLNPDDTIRKQIHEHFLRVARAAVKLKPVGCVGVAGFIGRNPLLDMDQNVALFEKIVIPLLKQLKAMRLKFYLEQCPMPGWNITDIFINNIGHCAGMWIKIYHICDKHGVADVFGVTYDESHDILMGNSHHGSFAAMKAAGLGRLVSRFHGKNQYLNLAKVACWTMRGQMIDLGCRIDGQPHPDPAKQGGAWGVMPCAHGMIGIGKYNPLAMFMKEEVDWLDHQIAARQILGLNPQETHFILEHEWNRGQVCGMELVITMLAISVAYIRGIDAAAEALCNGQWWCEEKNIPIPGTSNPMYNFPGIGKEVTKITA
jgi:hypothetical protein